MDDLRLGAYSLPLLVSLLLRWFYSLVGEGNITDRMKQTIPVIMGLCLAYLYMWYSGLEWSVKNMVDNGLYGVISLGLSSIGFYEITKTPAPPR